MVVKKKKKKKRLEKERKKWPDFLSLCCTELTAQSQAEYRVKQVYSP